MEPTPKKKKPLSSLQKTYPGINIQWPISELILSGEKTIETRTYPIPKKYLNQEMVLVETPGSKGKFKARTRAIIKFTDCFQYKNEKEFYDDFERHRVSKNSLWAWSDDKPKWGWVAKVIRIIKLPASIPNKRGIIYTKNIFLQGIYEKQM